MSSILPNPTTSIDNTAVVPSAVESIVQPVPSSEAAQSVAPSSAAATTPPASSAQPSPEPSSAAAQSSAAPESSAAPQSPSPQPTSAPASSAAAQSPSPQATSQAAAQSSAAPISQAVSEAAASQSQAASQASVAASSAAESVTAATSAATSQLTSAVDVTTTDASGKVVTTRPEVLTQTSISTDGSGKVYTVTQVVHQPTGALDSSGRNGGTESFFDNTGAVAGVFVVLGLALTAGVLAFVFFMLRRRRRQRLDRDVAAAAAAAAAGAHHSNRSAFDDDGYDEEKSANPAHTQYGGYYAATDIHGQPQPSMGQYDYEDPAGGYDHYANDLPPPGDRTSTATAAGMAGFGAQSAQTNYSNQNMYTHAEGYEEVADHNGYSAMSGVGHSQMQEGQRASNGGEFYFDPKQAGQYDYVEEDAYAYNDQPPRRARSGSEGSVARDAAAERALRVANE